MTYPKGRILENDLIPQDEIWFIQPGEVLRITASDGSVIERTIRAPKVLKMTNLGQSAATDTKVRG